MKRVVVTGMGIVSSIGNNIIEVLKSLQEGKSGIEFEPSHAERGFRSHVTGSLHIDVKEHISRRDLRFMGPGIAYNFIACEEALKTAGLSKEDIAENPRNGLIMGSGGPSTSHLNTTFKKFEERNSTKAISPFTVPIVMSSANSACLSTIFKIHGVSYSISSACSTGSHCIGNAMECIQSGKQDLVLCGGAEELHWSLSCMFDALGALSKKYNDSPSTASRAYDLNRDGFVISGGAGVLCLESLEHAESRNANIIAELVGYGATSDGFDMVQPSGEGAKRCMKLALESVKQPISYINTHGTSTPAGDIPELEAIKNVFAKDIPPISSTKSLTGHSLGASGAQEAIYCMLMMQNNFITASAHIENIDPKAENYPIVQKRIDDVNHTAIMSNSFGFGGTNAVLVFQNYK